MNVVTFLDTITSLLAGFTVFGILGNLAHVTGIEDFSGNHTLIQEDAGLAFMSYPDAIAKFDFIPQVCKVLL